MPLQTYSHSCIANDTYMNHTEQKQNEKIEGKIKLKPTRRNIVKWICYEYCNANERERETEKSASRSLADLKGDEKCTFFYKPYNMMVVVVVSPSLHVYDYISEHCIFILSILFCFRFFPVLNFGFCCFFLLGLISMFVDMYCNSSYTWNELHF